VTDAPILVLTQRFDPTADYVVAELNRRGAPVFRCDPGEFPATLVLAARLGDGYGLRGTLRLGNRVLRLDEVGCVYYRRPSAFEVPDNVRDRRWVVAEARMGLGGVLAALPRWLNHPADIARADYKPLQLVVAHAAGLRTPATLITNDPAEAATFVASAPAIYKPFTATPITDGKMIYATPIAADECDASIELTAHLFQGRLAKLYEIRATYVDGQIFATRIDTTSDTAGQDWRSDQRNVQFRAIDLDGTTTAAVRVMMGQLNLRFAALDFVVTPDDPVPVFLEVNPNGQWAFVEDATGQPITGAIADALQRS
jgi:ATP-grasp ribosomal peptide maturase